MNTVIDEFLNDFLNEEEIDNNNNNNINNQINDEINNLKEIIINNNNWKEIIQKIQHFKLGNNEINEQTEEYQLLLKIPEYLLEIEQQQQILYNHIKDIYSKHFPELEEFIGNKIDYCKVVQLIGNERNLQTINLSSILSQPIIMGIMTSSINLIEYKTKDLTQEELKIIENEYKIIENYLESKVLSIAPNTTTIIGSKITAQLISSAGGLLSLARLPANVISLLGQKKIHLNGFSSSHYIPHSGFIYESSLIQQFPQELRMKANNILAGKLTLAIRADSLQLNGIKNDQCGKELLEDIISFFNIIKPNNFEVRMFYARLLYPTYYFDVFENIIVVLYY